MCDRLSNFQTLCAHASLAEIARTPKSAIMAMLHLLIKSSHHFCCFVDVDASALTLQSLRNKKRWGGLREIAENRFDCSGHDAGGHATLRTSGWREGAGADRLGGPEGAGDSL